MLEPLEPTQKYFPLQEVLVKSARENKTSVCLSVKEINELIRRIGKGILPEAAYKYSVFWGNDMNSPTHMQKRAWLSTGYIVADTSNVVNSQRKDTDSIPEDAIVTFELIRRPEYAKIKEDSSPIEAVFSDLEIELLNDLQDVHSRIKNEIKSNPPNYYYFTLEEKGALQTVKELLQAPYTSDGYKILLMKGRLDLTVEFLIVHQDKYHSLFTNQELDTAKRRIYL